MKAKNITLLALLTLITLTHLYLIFFVFTSFQILVSFCVCLFFGMIQGGMMLLATIADLPNEEEARLHLAGYIFLFLCSAWLLLLSPIFLAIWIHFRDDRYEIIKKDEESRKVKVDQIKQNPIHLKNPKLAFGFTISVDPYSLIEKFSGLQKAEFDKLRKTLELKNIVFFDEDLLRSLEQLEFGKKLSVLVDGESFYIADGDGKFSRVLSPHLADLKIDLKVGDFFPNFQEHYGRCWTGNSLRYESLRDDVIAIISEICPSAVGVAEVLAKTHSASWHVPIGKWVNDFIILFRYGCLTNSVIVQENKQDAWKRLLEKGTMKDLESLSKEYKELSTAYVYRHFGWPEEEKLNEIALKMKFLSKFGGQISSESYGFLGFKFEHFDGIKAEVIINELTTPSAFCV